MARSKWSGPLLNRSHVKALAAVTMLDGRGDDGGGPGGGYGGGGSQGGGGWNQGGGSSGGGQGGGASGGHYDDLDDDIPF